MLVILVMSNFTLENYIVVEKSEDVIFFWWGMLGGRIQNRFFFWRLDIINDKLDLLGLSRATARSDWINLAISQVQADLIIDTPIIPIFISTNDHYLIVANEIGDIVIYKDGNSSPAGASNIIGKEPFKIEDIYLHMYYLIIKMKDTEEDSRHSYVFNLDIFSLNGEFQPDIYELEVCSGKYIVQRGLPDPTNNPSRFTFYNLDNVQEKKHSLTEYFEDKSYTVLRYNGIIMFEPFGLLYCYDIDQDKLIWQLNMNGCHLSVIELDDEKILVEPQNINTKSNIYYIVSVSNGAVLKTIPSNSVPESGHMYPVKIPNTNQTKYVFVNVK